jgi:CRISPR-associated protein Cmr4
VSDKNLYLIRTLSNLHAGAGDRSFGLIDKHVQRDPTTHLPTIYASSIKGALRELFTYHHPEKVRNIFGSDNQPNGEINLQQGKISISDAKLLALPVRSTHGLYYVATTPPLLKDFLEDTNFKGPNSAKWRAGVKSMSRISPTPGEPIAYDTQESDHLYLEDMPAQTGLPGESYLKDLFGRRIALFHVEDFARLAKNLPVVARNSLNNGISENLWYEEIVGREARFYCTISDYPVGNGASQEVNELATALPTIQIGANATVGFGQTKWTSINQ